MKVTFFFFFQELAEDFSKYFNERINKITPLFSVSLSLKKK